ncbi:hypothetical protein J6TS1_27350 [Siminovitchia terrae]|uniref:HIT domain-containing protein n=1 Tax=Siminovitchia terrae TaxID=1914933 RepID=A0ABQ4KXV7_SIMTE|nr:hypothetical protein [Siminovitchia terrae]GIN96865.1 hypothetical protein J6TS1_27350 [Siminovitchia terrae]
MSGVLGDFSNKFKIEKLKIFETKYWIWSLRPYQTTLGAGILSLKRECVALSELKSDEFCDLDNMIKVIEKTLKHAFNYDIINYLMLMMIDKQVHYHIIPRYKAEVKYFKKLWTDSSWPGVPDLAGGTLSKDELSEICLYIKENLIFNK